MGDITRAEARKRGIRMAARIAGLGGIALAAVGVAEARAEERIAPAATSVPAAGDDARVTPLEAFSRQSNGGNCGCSPCWGPPAPPRKSARRARRTSGRGRR